MAKQFPNKFPARCSECGSHVAEQAGLTEKGAPGGPKWVTTCRACIDGVVVEEEVFRPSFPPTDEQLTVKAKFLAGETFAVQAGAGAGKTTTFVLLANSTDRLGQYIAYNNAIAHEAASKLPKRCASATLHAIARRQVGHHYGDRIGKGNRQTTHHLAKKLGLTPFFYTQHGEDKVIQPKQLVGYVSQAIVRFCSTADRVPSIKHVAYVDGIDDKDDAGNRTFANNALLREHIAEAIDTAWDDIVDPDGTLRFEHDHYVKIWELGIYGPAKIPGDYILFDEAQDATPVFISAVQQQGVQVVWCGDSQQAIYEWRGAVDALTTVPVDSTTFLTQSFRFGPEIAAVANVLLTELDAELRVVGAGKPGQVGACDNPDAILCRTNSGAVSVVLEALKEGKTTHLVGGGGEVTAFAKAAKELQETGSTGHPELSIFDSWAAVEDYVANDPGGDDLKVLVTLINTYGVEDVIKASSNEVKEADADIIVSTAHKSKGREWDSVRLHSDFPENSDDLKLLYVSATRAKLHLDFEVCTPLRNLIYGEVDD
jgi:AAA domain/UvrD-like helicase C-terminal domain